MQSKIGSRSSPVANSDMLKRKSMKRLQQFCTIAFLFCCLPLTLANAQSASSAQISGTVVDPNGAVVPGAKVTATNVATGVPRSVNTTSTGNYLIPNLSPGTYDV